MRQKPNPRKRYYKKIQFTFKKLTSPSSLKKFMYSFLFVVVTLPILGYLVVNATQSSEFLMEQDVTKVIIYDTGNVFTNFDLQKYEQKEIYVVSNRFIVRQEENLTLLVLDKMNGNCVDEILEIGKEFVLVADASVIKPLAYNCKSKGALVIMEPIGTELKTYRNIFSYAKAFFGL